MNYFALMTREQQETRIRELARSGMPERMIATLTGYSIADVRRILSDTAAIVVVNTAPYPMSAVTMSSNLVDRNISIVIKRNNFAVKTQCALCDLVDRPDSPFAPMIEGTEEWVCFRCFQKHTLPYAYEALHLMNLACEGGGANLPLLCELAGRLKISDIPRNNNDATADDKLPPF